MTLPIAHLGLNFSSPYLSGRKKLTQDEKTFMTMMIPENRYKIEKFIDQTISKFYILDHLIILRQNDDFSKNTRIVHAYDTEQQREIEEYIEPPKPIVLNMKKMIAAATKIQAKWRAKLKRAQYELLRDRKWRILSKIETEQYNFHYSVRMIERLPGKNVFIVYFPLFNLL